LPNVGPYIYDVSISGFTRSSIYIYDISSLRVNFQLMHTTLQNVELLKHFKISKTAPTCFGKPKHVGAVLLTLKCSNNSTFFNVVCISWKLKCWILLMHGVTMKFTWTYRNPCSIQISEMVRQKMSFWNLKGRRQKIIPLFETPYKPKHRAVQWHRPNQLCRRITKFSPDTVT